MKSNMKIEVEFLAGTRIEDVIAEAKQKALQWDVAYVGFNFNGVRFSIGRNAVVQDVIEEWNADKNAKYGICAA